MNTSQHSTGDGDENQQRKQLVVDSILRTKRKENLPTGDSRTGDVTKSRLISRLLLDGNLSTTTATSNRGRALTFSDVGSDFADSDVSTSTYHRRLPAAERDRAASLLNLKRGSTLYFGKDITTSMWWKYRQLHEGVGALQGGFKPQLENSYQLEPKMGHKFAPGKVEDLIREVLACLFERETYDPKKAAVLAAAISDTVKQKVKMMCAFDRYRYVVNVDIGSRIAGQEVVIASRFLWNDDTDGFATVTAQNSSMYAVVTVYSVYLD